MALVSISISPAGSDTKSWSDLLSGIARWQITGTTTRLDAKSITGTVTRLDAKDDCEVGYRSCPQV